MMDGALGPLELGRVAVELLDRAQGTARLLPEKVLMWRDVETRLFELDPIPTTHSRASVAEVIEYLARGKPPAWLGAVEKGLDALLPLLPEQVALRPVTARFYGGQRVEIDGVIWFPAGGQPRPVAEEILAEMRLPNPPSGRDPQCGPIEYGFVDETWLGPHEYGPYDRKIVEIPAARMPDGDAQAWLRRLEATAQRFRERLNELVHTCAKCRRETPSRHIDELYCSGCAEKYFGVRH